MHGTMPQPIAWFAIAVFNHWKASDEIHELGFPLFCPMERKFKRFRGRKVPAEHPLFPGYLFASFNRNTDDWGQIDHVDGVMGILRNGPLPIQIPEAEIDRLRIAESIGVFDRTKPPKIGLEVEALDGPFAGWIGKITRARSSERVDVLLSFLGRMVEVNLPISALREV